jgi:hypothetical protein
MSFYIKKRLYIAFVTHHKNYRLSIYFFSVCLPSILYKRMFHLISDIFRLFQYFFSFYLRHLDIFIFNLENSLFQVVDIWSKTVENSIARRWGKMKQRKQIRRMANMQYLVYKRQKPNPGTINQQSTRYSRLQVWNIIKPSPYMYVTQTSLECNP